ncbi:aspartyl-phosphate phosphatase Spo0E family protein [Clostridium botulinum]|uniref:Aspartyl-phosphate phosphatase Spo0E family protein n=1 Tax=Clostridium botulinum TaxID=1491 RepID=A0A9Q4TH43_CLOBO|nr:aspartyl-phosphate phosphatase Spo0E family protein [Clostridium botulinum]
MNELSNSLQEIKVLIEKLRDSLNELVVYSGKDNFDEEIIKLSEVLDKLIAKYMIYTK